VARGKEAMMERQIQPPTQQQLLLTGDNSVQFLQ
jgi:hypothetical protein